MKQNSCQIHQQSPTQRAHGTDSEMHLAEFFFRHVDAFESNESRLVAATFVADSLLCQAAQALG